MRLSDKSFIFLYVCFVAVVALVISFVPKDLRAATPTPSPAPTTCYSWTAAPYNGTFCGPKADMNIQIGKAS